MTGHVSKSASSGVVSMPSTCMSTARGSGGRTTRRTWPSQKSAAPTSDAAMASLTRSSPSAPSKLLDSSANGGGALHGAR